MCAQFRAVLASIVLTVAPAIASAAWVLVAAEQGKRVEIDRASIVVDRNEMATARGRVVLDKPIVDPKTSASYRIIEVVNRYDCVERTLATLKRASTGGTLPNRVANSSRISRSTVSLPKGSGVCP